MTFGNVSKLAPIVIELPGVGFHYPCSGIARALASDVPASIRHESFGYSKFFEDLSAALASAKCLTVIAVPC
jgi:hypothetical protein